MSEVDTFGITLPVRDWRALFDLSKRADRSPSDYLRLLIRQEHDRVYKAQPCAVDLPHAQVQLAQPQPVARG